MLFFVCSGAELKLSVLSTVGVIGVIYIIVRVVGKICGAAFGAAICKAEPNVKKYLGFSLIPQAGVAIGLSLVATQVMPEFGAQIRAIILCGTLIYELIGPGITKFALTKAVKSKKILHNRSKNRYRQLTIQNNENKRLSKAFVLERRLFYYHLRIS
jgi:Kef-type K+ transport system membrane component KefB